jgi:hypothetical protein
MKAGVCNFACTKGLHLSELKGHDACDQLEAVIRVTSNKLNYVQTGNGTGSIVVMMLTHAVDCVLNIFSNQIAFIQLTQAR